ncbi:MAG: helix-turn-helix domain-containing protein [Actinomycetota bacterium]|nr:MAG: helix-turn-helix domain-containing protein [Actinomycetota bacterium]
MAEAVGVAQRTVARWELGQNPHAKHLVRYIAVLDELKALA